MMNTKGFKDKEWEEKNVALASNFEVDRSSSRSSKQSECRSKNERGAFTFHFENVCVIFIKERRPYSS